jgi:hypothetical protein
MFEQLSKEEWHFQDWHVGEIEDRVTVLEGEPTGKKEWASEM